MSRSLILALAPLALIACRLPPPDVETVIHEGRLTARDNAPVSEAFDEEFEGCRRDVYPVLGVEGQILSVDLTADFDCYLALIDPRGEIIDRNDDAGGNRRSRLEEVPIRETGAHLIVVTSFREDTEGHYTLEITGPEDPPPPPPDQPIERGSRVEGQLWVDDEAGLARTHEMARNRFRDGYTFGAEAGETLIIDLTADFDAYLILIGPDGQVIAENDDHVTMYESRIEATATATGAHRVVVTSFRQQTTGNYELTVR
ncbi:PPC domain-containing protein [Candidatus Sumerlaeota bacterium]|nr:PPC domain-containing protein [Candidatus Sumerlaeota bacterium]